MLHAEQLRQAERGSLGAAQATRQDRSRSSVDPSTTGAHQGGLGGRAVDITAGGSTTTNSVDRHDRLAKVRVAGSNPVVRSLETSGVARGFARLTCGFVCSRSGLARFQADKADPGSSGLWRRVLPHFVPGIVPVGSVERGPARSQRVVQTTAPCPERRAVERQRGPALTRR